MLQTIVRLPFVLFHCGLSRSTLYSRIKEGLWTKPIPLGGRSVGWAINEIEALNSSRIAGKSDQEIKELVIKLEADRKAADQ